MKKLLTVASCGGSSRLPAALIAPFITLLCLVGGSATAAAEGNGLPPRPGKEAWEKGIGPREAIRAQLKARLAGWPETALVNGATLPDDERAFLMRLAADTWRGLTAFVDRENGLPVDNVRFGEATVDADQAAIGDYTSPTDIGMRLIGLTAAVDLGFLDRAQAVQAATLTLSTLERLETYRGFHYNYYDTTTLERSSHFLSSVDSAWLTAGLMVARQGFGELAERCGRLIAQANYGFFFDPALQHMRQGYYADRERFSEHHYGMLYTEARLASLIAIGKGDVPAEHWFRMHRTLPEDQTWQTMPPVGRRPKTYGGFETQGGRYRWQGLEFVPSWGGSMFEALMPRLVLDESAYAPESLGRNGVLHAQVQRRYATEVLRYPVWGMSPSSIPGSTEYGEFGAKVLGVAGYRDGVVTPHAAALALLATPRAAVENLRQLARRYPVYGEYGYYDAVNPLTGQVSYAYMFLDQSMIFIALADYLTGGAVQKRFAADPVMQRALPLLRLENFFD